MNIAIVGYGKMGRMIERLASYRGITIATKLDEFNNANFEGINAPNFANIEAIGKAMTCLVGENIRDTPGVAVRVFSALKDVNIRMTSQGASLLNLSVMDPEVFE